MKPKTQRRYKDPLIKPFLKWAGGKRQILPVIKQHLPTNLSSLIYYEPFVGAGALFFECQPRRAVINDYNYELILAYQIIRNNLNELVNVLQKHKENNSEEYFYKVREQDRDLQKYHSMTDIEKVARLIYLNKTCFNGLYRVNSQGMFNVPYGRYKNPTIWDDKAILAIHKYLNHVNCQITISHGDFAESVKNATKNSFIYFDPPYHSPDNTNFTGYQAGGFEEDEQNRLKDVFVEKTNSGVKCLLSNSDTSFIRTIYHDERFTIIPIKAKRAINSDSAGRGEVDEVLIKNWRD